MVNHYLDPDSFQLYIKMGNNATFKMKVTTNIFLCLCVLLFTPIISSAMTFEAAQLTRSRLAEAFSSPSGKLTLSPEVIIEDPTSPTAILLQSSAVSTLSKTLRTKAKANGAFLSCPTASSISSVRTFCNEQEEARGKFPGPIPVIYCEQQPPLEDEDTIPDLTEIAQAGVSGILVSIPQQEIAIGKDLGNDVAWIQKCHHALQVGLQPIPEILVQDSVASTWKEDDMEQLVMQISNAIGQDPVSVLVTIQSDSNGDRKQYGDNDNKNDEEDCIIPLPIISKTLGRKVPIMGSIRTLAGANRLAAETARWKAAGFTGAVLRQECIPGFQNKPTLEYVSDFWAACIGDLKSTRSKSFKFQSRNYLEKSVPLEWAKYQRNVIDSGALGAAEDNAPPGFNPDAGDYQGF
jgi:hypothetical protein